MSNDTSPTHPKLRKGTWTICSKVSSGFSQVRSALLHGNLRKPYPIVTKQSGNWQWTREDDNWEWTSQVKKHFDASGGAATGSVGYNNRRVMQAIKDQLDDVAVSNELSFRTAISEAFAQALIATTEGHMARVFVCNSGSDATETTVKMALQYHSSKGERRAHFISREKSYHGSTMYALALSGHKLRQETYQEALEPMSANISFVSACNEYRDRGDRTVEEYVKYLRDELEREFQRVGPNRVAAFIAEPVVGAALGCAPALPGYLKAMKEVCQDHGALFIADEVMCGAGRTGTMHAWQQEEGFVPDIQTMGKALTGGYAPIGAVLASHEVSNVLKDNVGAFAHGYTYQGHPQTCAAGLEVLNIIRDEGLLKNVRKMGGRLHQGLKDELASHKNVGDIRGRGLFQTIEFVKNKETKEPFPFQASDKKNIARRLQQKALSEDYEMYFYTGTGSADGILGDHIIIAPAYNVTKKDIDHIVRTISRLVNDFFDELEDA